jgi:hypothetical protein
LKAGINGIGAIVTGLTVVIIGVSKFLEGGWITVFVIPLLVVMFLRIRDHYRTVSLTVDLRSVVV